MKKRKMMDEIVIGANLIFMVLALIMCRKERVGAHLRCEYFLINGANIGEYLIWIDFTSFSVLNEV